MPTIPVGSIVFTNGGISDAALRWYDPSTGSEILTGPTVTPGSDGSPYDYNIVQNPNGDWMTLSDNFVDPTFPFGEVWDFDWTNRVGTSQPYKGGLATALSSGHFYTQGNRDTPILPYTSIGQITKFASSSGAQIASWDITAMLPLITGNPNISALNTASVAVSPDETIAYWIGSGASAALGTGVRRWDLTGNTYLGELIPKEASGASTRNGMIVLQDGTIVVGWRSGLLKRYSAAGVLLNTYTPPSDGGGEYYL